MPGLFCAYYMKKIIKKFNSLFLFRYMSVLCTFRRVWHQICMLIGSNKDGEAELGRSTHLLNHILTTLFYNTGISKTFWLWYHTKYTLLMSCNLKLCFVSAFVYERKHYYLGKLVSCFGFWKDITFLVNKIVHVIRFENQWTSCCVKGSSCIYMKTRI